MNALVSGGDVLTCSDYSDSDVTQWILRAWRDAAFESRHHAPSSVPSAALHHHSSQLTLQLTAAQLFGDKSVVRSGGSHEPQHCIRIADPKAVKRRYHQLALRVHPDKNASAYAAEAFQLVQSCFEFAVSAGSGVTGWTWCPLFCTQSVQAWEVEKAEAGRATNDVASVPSSLFSSSSSLASSTAAAAHNARSPSVSSSPRSSSNRSVSSTADDPRVNAARYVRAGTHAQTSSSSPLYKHTSIAGTGESPEMETTVPEPPTVFFDSYAASSDSKCYTPHTAFENRQEKERSSPQPPPPPCVFDDEEIGKKREGQNGDGDGDDDHPPLPSALRHDDARGAKLDSHQPNSFSKRSGTHTRRERDGRGVHHRQDNSKPPSFAASADATTAFSPEVPPPPVVFDVPLPATATRTTGRQAEDMEDAAPHKASRRHRQRPELPTLAELLAQLDVEDDGIQGEVERDLARASSHESSSRADSFQPTQTPAEVSPHFYRHYTDITAHLKGTLHTSRTSRAKHGYHRHAETGPVDKHVPCAEAVALSLSGASRNSDNRRSPEAGSCGGTARDAHLSSASRRTSAHPMLFDEETSRHDVVCCVVGDVRQTERAPVGTAVRSRRAGGASTKRDGVAHATHAAPAEERCACGKARRGQCFLCE